MKYIYLHGFASSPRSSKAQFFLERMPDLLVPALDGGDFENLTISAQLEIIDRTAGGERSALIGSSMGGYLSALYASLHPAQVDRVVLLAPAFQCIHHWESQWNGAEYIEVFHYGERNMRRLSRRFFEDLAQYPPEPHFEQPGLIFHGVRDDVVLPEYAQRFAATRPNVKLRMLDSDHQLTDVIETIWAESEPFLR